MGAAVVAAAFSWRPASAHEKARVERMVRRTPAVTYEAIPDGEVAGQAVRLNVEARMVRRVGPKQRSSSYELFKGAFKVYVYTDTSGDPNRPHVEITVYRQTRRGGHVLVARRSPGRYPGRDWGDLRPEVAERLFAEVLRQHEE
jgi:hypothetical protein